MTAVSATTAFDWTPPGPGPWQQDSAHTPVSQTSGDAASCTRRASIEASPRPSPAMACCSTGSPWRRSTASPTTSRSRSTCLDLMGRCPTTRSAPRSAAVSAWRPRPWRPSGGCPISRTGTPSGSRRPSPVTASWPTSTERRSTRPVSSRISARQPRTRPRWCTSTTASTWPRSFQSGTSPCSPPACSGSTRRRCSRRSTATRRCPPWHPTSWHRSSQPSGATPKQRPSLDSDGDPATRLGRLCVAAVPRSTSTSAPSAPGCSTGSMSSRPRSSSGPHSCSVASPPRSTADPDDARRRSDAFAPDLRDQLAPDQQSHFDELLADARAVYRLRDERGLYSDVTAIGLLRLAMLEVGRRLAADGVLRDAELALDATIDELASASLGTGSIDGAGWLPAATAGSRSTPPVPRATSDRRHRRRRRSTSSRRHSGG